MKLGLDSYSYHLAFGAHPDFEHRNPMDLFQFMDRVAGLGLDGFQIDPMHMESRDKGYLSELTAHAGENNLFMEYGAMGIDAAYLKRELDVCAALGSRVLRTFIDFNRYDQSTKVEDEIELAIDQLKRVRGYAEALDISIAIENHGDVSATELVEIIQRVNSPHVGICLDLGNALLTFENPLEAATKMAPYACSTHFKDYAIQMTNYGFKVSGVALGDGNIDLESAMKIIREKSSLDRIILEIPVEAGGSTVDALVKEDHYIRKSIVYARNVLGIR
ncbi:MAG: sugar phosphate isomerase/epimerase [candidate division KSB1 bacterium]|jgi:sugar phosphate isomerase/epimerase|nr:sugar phosphate isomerase/epimerase [candidate division KSB1 bacterium]